MSRTYAVLFALGLAVGGLGAPVSGHAQTAAELNRLNQAMAVCNSPVGALSTECQQLKALSVMGAVPGVQGVPGAGASSQQAMMVAQQIYAACVQRAGLNQTALAQCNASLNNTMGLPQPKAGPYNQYDRQTNTAMNIAAGGQSYQGCVAAMMAQGQQPGGINPCTPLLSGNPAGPGAPAGFGAPQAYNPPAPNFIPAVPPAPPAQRIDPLAPPANRPLDPLGL